MCQKDMKREYIVIGITNRPGGGLSSAAEELWAGRRVYSGGDRHYRLLKDRLPAGHVWIPIRGTMPDLFERYREVPEPVIVVFASGDPLFFGMAETIRRYDPDAVLRVHPAFASIQLLCARIGQPYQRVRHVSVHGRGWAGLDSALLRGEPLISVLTDARHHPAAIAQRLLEYGFDGYEVVVGEELDGAEERVRRMTLEVAAGEHFRELNCVLLRMPEARSPALGIGDDCFEGLPGRPLMITKKVLRLASLSALQLHRARVFWDIGACTGSVSIEARRLFPELVVHAWERREECAGILQRNMRRLSAPGIELHLEDFLEAGTAVAAGVDMAAPDAVFIGGHGGRLVEVMEKIDGRFAAGVVVLNAVLESSREQFVATAGRLGWAMSGEDRVEVNGHNAVTVMAARKELRARKK